MSAMVARGCCRVAGCGNVRTVKVRDWMLADHADVRERFERGVAARVPLERWGEHADGGGSSIAWLVLHHSYHQDLAVNTVIRNREPLLAAWRDRLGLAGFGPAAGLPEAEDPELVDALDFAVLADYAAAVHEATHQWMHDVAPSALDTFTDASARISRVGVSVDEVGWLHAMWEGKPVSWFARWEAIGHGHTHVGEMVSVRNRMGLSPH
jgi:hypothetical protein